MMMRTEAEAVQHFAESYGELPALLVRAPGRVNLIGEHTDYNDGFVLPMAIDRAVWIAARPRNDLRLTLQALTFDGRTDTDLSALVHEDSGWPEYVKGVAYVLSQNGYDLRGWDGVIAGNVPIGAGLSSSAALEMATARVFASFGGWPWDPTQMALVGQRAENEWVGVNCGIMDQLISAAGEPGHALLIDCRSLAVEPVPLPPGTSVVILDTATRRGLVESAYNERRQQCETAAEFFEVLALRDVTQTKFADRESELNPITRRRARHVITENARTIQAADAMRHGDAIEMGRLMNESHISMRDDFEISRAEMDVMVDLAQVHEAAYGARMTGGGFGGSAVALVQQEGTEAFARDVAAAYQAATGLRPEVYVCHAVGGASIVVQSDLRAARDKPAF